MDLSALDTIDDPKALRALLATAHTTIERQQALIDTRERTITLRDAQIAALTAEIARLRRLQFSAKTERMDPDQRQLFEDTMAADIAAVEAQLAALQAEGETAAVTQKRRRAANAGRKPLPEHLERVETRHEPANCNCPQCNSALVAIGEHVSERLACKPLEFYVKRDVYPQYSCRRCELIVAEPVAARSSSAARPMPACWPRSLSQSMSITCRCIGRKPFMHAAALPCRVARWPSGSAPSAWRCNRWPTAWRCGCSSNRCCMPMKPRCSCWIQQQAPPSVRICLRMPPPTTRAPIHRWWYSSSRPAAAASTHAISLGSGAAH
ncbi:IS66 family transposase zinc-finger binding domain-containing protein [Xanthomonas cucurbitae]|nr:IS66 family transposase zinc-finger binding domain-containing protein [Xanthomonas cucurbitae]